jgi:alpha-L-fucosidase
MFIHFGPYAQYGRGEQVLFRENLDQKEYAAKARGWKAPKFDAEAWAKAAKGAGMKYAVLTTRHHDGYCLWDSKLTSYTSAAQAAKRDFVGEYVRAFRKAGLRVGLYYSLADWRVPAYWTGPKTDPAGWDKFRDYVHGQVREILSNYGKIDVIWFDGAWPHPAKVWQSEKLIKMIRTLQPEILINNRLGSDDEKDTCGISHKLGDFGTPEQEIRAENRLWESCQTSTWRLWGYTIGERWRTTDILLDSLIESASLGGNFLLNVGPKPDGTLPPQFLRQLKEIGQWMKVHGEMIYNSEAGDACEFITYGRQMKKGNNLYLIVRFWDGRDTLHLAGLKTKVKSAVLMMTGKKLTVRQEGDHLYVSGLPKKAPTKLFPVIKLVCAGKPEAASWAVARLWGGDPARMLPWAKGHGKEY